MHVSLSVYEFLSVFCLSLAASISLYGPLYVYLRFRFVVDFISLFYE